MRHLPPSELPREVTSPVPLLLGRYGLGTVCRVRFGPVSGFSSGFPARQPLSFLLPSTRPSPFRVNGRRFESCLGSSAGPPVARPPGQLPCERATYDGLLPAREVPLDRGAEPLDNLGAVQRHNRRQAQDVPAQRHSQDLAA